MALKPSLMVPGNAEEMANYYVDLFPDGRLLHTAHVTPPDSNEPMVVAVSIRVDGTELILVNGAHHPDFGDALSLTIPCSTQDEVDAFTEKLIADGGEQRDCGWCNDKFGVRWQVTPDQLWQGITDTDLDRASRAFAAMLTMQKIDIDAIDAAVEGNEA